MDRDINRVLIAVDASNLEYVIANSTAWKWGSKHREEASILKAPRDTDQDNLPNLLNIDSFKRFLYKTTQEKLSFLEHILKSNHQDILNKAEGIDMFFVYDDYISQNFRKKLYPEYKAQRKLSLQSYDCQAIKRYIENIIFEDLDIEKSLGYKSLKLENCECDDIISVLMNKYKNYVLRIIISSDRDFLQLDGNVIQYDAWGDRVEFRIKNHEEFKLNAKEFLYWKILRGDKSDNIKNVFPNVGDVKSYNLIKNKQILKQMLKENQEASSRFLMNKKLIDFDEIPNDIKRRISDLIEEKMKIKTQKELIEEFSLNECINI